MYIIRSVKLSDVDDLYELSQLVTLINLPRDLSLIEKMVRQSIESFKEPDLEVKSNNHFVFVLEDLTRNRVIGASMIHGQHGTEDEPHYFLSVGQEHKFSESLNTGFIHGTLSLDYEHNGWSELGGLILHPDYRANGLKLGKQLSFSRFIFIALNKHLFTKTIHTELMPPFDSDGNSPLWEAIGRRFMNLDYDEADLLSRKNKEFILSLWPSGKIYTTLLPVEARDSIGKVGEDTLPVKKMLEAIGFSYTKEVDPFDGGPHYRAVVEKIKPVKELKNVTVKIVNKFSTTKGVDGLFLFTCPSKSDPFVVHGSKGRLIKDVLELDNFSLTGLNTNEFTSHVIQI